jgi:hypothetical protein
MPVIPKEFGIPPSVFEADETTLLKLGQTRLIAREVEAMRFANQHTSISTPRILEEGTNGLGYFKTNRVKGFFSVLS